MCAIQMPRTTDRFKISEIAPRRRSTRTRRSPGQWWKEGPNPTASKLPNVVQIELLSLLDSGQRPSKRRGPRISKIEQPRKPRLRPRSQETFQSGRKGVEQKAEVRVNHEATDDEVSTVVFDSATTYESEVKPLSEASNASGHPFLNEIVTTVGPAPSPDIAKVDILPFDSKAYHLHSTSATCTAPQTEMERQEQHDNPKHSDKSASKTKSIKNQGDEELDCFEVENRNSDHVSSGLQTGRSCETWLSVHRVGGICFSLPPRPHDAIADKRSVREVKGEPLRKQLVSKDYQEGKLTPLSTNVSQNLPRHILANDVSTRPSGQLVDGCHKDRQNPGRHYKLLSNDIDYTSGKDVRKLTCPSLQTVKTINTTHGVALHQFEEPHRQDDPEECYGAEETMPGFCRKFQVSESCSSCSSQVCVCELNHERATATAQPTMGFKVRRGSKIHYANEKGVYGLIKFGIRSCSDGVLVGELTVCPQSATGPRRTCGYKEWYIVLRGFLILEVDDSTIHLREGDEVEFEGNTVFQLRNRCLRSADLLCFLLTTE